LDKFNNLSPAGVKGELHIGGMQVASGYLGKPALTQEKFILSPFKSSEILYKTGDLACWLPNGNLQFFGRNDLQVKIHGYRIELLEIEAVLVKIPSIHQAIVVVKKGHFKDKYLKAYLVADEKLLSSRDITTFLASYLPSYMIPEEFYITRAIPLKENEKIDFDVLETQPGYYLTFEHEVDEELTEYEKICMSIWQQAFNSHEIASQDNFFDIGGNSLLALQIITQLKKYYNVQIPLYYLFEYPTVSSLSLKLDELVQGKERASVQNVSRSIIQLSKGVHPIPLFLVHPVGGSVFWYKQLAKQLEGQYTIYGIQDVSIDGESLKFRSLEDMATHYLQEIAGVYTGDSYCLGGASFGSTVAFEMARQLQNSSKKVVFLGLFDGWATYPDELMKENTLIFLSQREKNDVLSEEERTYLEGLEEYRKNLLLNYQLPILSMDITLFKATHLWGSLVPVDDTYNGWRAYIEGEISVRKISGTHETMFFEPNVHLLANQLSKILCRIDRTSSVDQAETILY